MYINIAGLALLHMPYNKIIKQCVYNIMKCFIKLKIHELHGSNNIIMVDFFQVVFHNVRIHVVS